MSSSAQAQLLLLLVEDNPGDAQLVSELLDDGSGERFEIIHVSGLTAAVEVLQAKPVDVVLTDLGLPDGSGVDVVTALRRVAAEVPIVVLTGAGDQKSNSDADHDQGLALACLTAGAQDYLAKTDVQTRSLKRAIGYAVSRLREQQMRNMQTVLERYRALSAQGQTTSVTASLSGAGAVSLREPGIFADMVRGYFRLLEPYLLRESERIEAPRPDKEHIIATLGDANGGPRDLLDVHVAALDQALALYTDPHARTVVFEARLLALEMMGLLVDYYRVGHRRRFSREQLP